jgi:DNA-binding GntR family transcriptional regulator
MSKVADLTYQGIRDRIISGEYAPGAHLKEELVAEDTGASRTPVREALRRLNAEHLVEFVPNRGAYVASWSLEDVEEIYTLRSVLEGQAAFRAATRISGDEIDMLIKCADQIDELLERKETRPTAEIVEANHQFHNTILDAAHSERLTKMLSWLVEIPVTLQTFEKYSDRDIARSNHHHRELIDAFNARDPHWAQKSDGNPPLSVNRRLILTPDRRANLTPS